ncbi:DUF1871 family protein [Metabacillus fastidiosus]|uniref:DUF1871 family protein n=3 Tax=Metabacillus fastidiosus TaxID=1458 RepID=A0ABU6P202_9BACI|nr:DUF1871 family protein [Metabacillus fastidiosus]MED4403033.1 DUF1871 family protein [Metabacillus fastidiosus]MED4455263.1 DUF1871 family protein [Metabacillus fastidiosus]
MCFNKDKKVKMMETQRANIQMVVLLSEWDPFGCGEDHYEPEIVDVIQAVHTIDQAGLLARKIQSIYEFSFEEVIPLVKCEAIAEKLLAIKNEASCEI